MTTVYLHCPTCGWFNVTLPYPAGAQPPVRGPYCRPTCPSPTEFADLCPEDMEDAVPADATIPGVLVPAHEAEQPWTRRLIPSDVSDWRQGEACLIRVLRRLEKDTPPNLDDFSYADQRRLGYLSELAALLLEADDPPGLLAYAAEAERRAPRDPNTAQRFDPLIPGQATRGRQLDRLAAAWGFDPGLDIGRYRAEIPALLEESNQEKPDLRPVHRF